MYELCHAPLDLCNHLKKMKVLLMFLATGEVAWFTLGSPCRRFVSVHLALCRHNRCVTHALPANTSLDAASVLGRTT